MNIFTTISRID